MEGSRSIEGFIDEWKGVKSAKLYFGPLGKMNFGRRKSVKAIFSLLFAFAFSCSLGASQEKLRIDSGKGFVKRENWLPACCKQRESKICEKLAKRFFLSLNQVDLTYGSNYSYQINEQVKALIFPRGRFNNKKSNFEKWSSKDSDRGNSNLKQINSENSGRATSNLEQVKSELLVTGNTRSEHLISRRFDPEKLSSKEFWKVFCVSNWNKSAQNQMGKMPYISGFITIHDEGFGQKFFEGDQKGDFSRFVETLEETLSVLLGEEGQKQKEVNPALFQDRVRILYANYVSRVFNGWADIGYHFLIGKGSGKVFEGRSLSLQGAHAGSPNWYNKTNKISPNIGNIGLALMGNYHHSDKIPPVQKKTAARLVNDLKSKFSIHNSHITSHNFWKDTTCGIGEINRWLRAEFSNPEIGDERSFAKVSTRERMRRFRKVYDYIKRQQ